MFTSQYQWGQVFLKQHDLRCMDVLNENSNLQKFMLIIWILCYLSLSSLKSCLSNVIGWWLMSPDFEKKVCSGCKTLTALVKFFLPFSFRFFRKISYLWQTLVWNTCIFSLPVICCDRKFCEKIFLAPSHSTSSFDDRIEGVFGADRRESLGWRPSLHLSADTWQSPKQLIICFPMMFLNSFSPSWNLKIEQEKNLIHFASCISWTM